MFSNKKATIMIIDSDPITVKKLSDRLSSVGFSVISATTADTAYRLFLVSKPDIILLDILMKDNDGIEVFNKIQPKASTDNVPIIILSQEVDASKRVYSFMTGASDYVIKPYRFAEVLARINTQLKIVGIQNELEKRNKELLEKNAVLQHLAITDSLTGLYNRGYLLNKLHNDIAHSIRYKEPISFILADLDHFKRINDKYGHLGGDKILKDTAETIKNSLREVDVVARYGGEEFLIICPNTDKSGALKVAERIRKSIYNQKFYYMDKKIHITISLGIKSTILDMHVNAQDAIYELIEAADKALYKAKAKGRNRVEVHDDSQNYSNLRKNKSRTEIDTIRESTQANDKFLN